VVNPLKRGLTPDTHRLRRRAAGSRKGVESKSERDICSRIRQTRLQPSDRLTPDQIRRIICMLDRTDLEPVFFAPFVSSVMRVDPAWIDYNGHLNMAYYNVLFDRAVDEAFELVGVGPSYVQRRRRSFFTAEVHLRYLRELHLGDPVRVTLQLLDYDRKRLHFFEQLFHATDGWVSATSENLSLHVDLEAKKAVAFSDAVADRLALMKAAHAMLPRPEVAGRSIEMPGGN
jgi:acyl-CoA thioester hydrolase